MTYKFVRNETELAANITAFNNALAKFDELAGQNKYDISIVTARSRLWVALPCADGGYAVGPCKYIAISGVTPEFYSQYRHIVHSGNAANHIRQWLPKTPVNMEHPAWRQVAQVAATYAPGERPHLNAEVFVLPEVSTTQVASFAFLASAPTLTPLEEREVELVLGLSALLAPHVRTTLAHRMAAL